MTDPAEPAAAPPPAAPFPTRRRVLRSARALGLAAAGIVAFGPASTEAAGGA